MRKYAHPLERTIKTISFKDVEFEVVERPSVLWIGCIGYANDTINEPNIEAILKRFQKLVESVPIQKKVNPDWSAALSINYNFDKKPCGIMFANESYSDKQDGRYDQFTQPGGLWLRVCVCQEADTALLGRQNYGMYEYFRILKDAAQKNGYCQNPDVHIEIEYHCHAEYSLPTHTSYAYIPIISI